MPAQPTETAPSQVTTGLRSVLSLAPAYRFTQWALGAPQSRDAIAREYFKVGPETRLVDLGCGTADILDHLPPHDYLGFDVSERYISDARQRYGTRGRFTTNPEEVDALSDRTLAIAIGVLHHMSDEESEQLLRQASSTLASGGRFVSIDPVLVDGQSKIARAMITRDRGQNVRSPEHIRELVGRVFPYVETTVRHDLLRIPYSHVIVTAGNSPVGDSAQAAAQDSATVRT